VRLADHPLHPMLVHFPIAAWSAAVAMDLSTRIWRVPVLAVIGSGCVTVGLSMGALAMIAGYIDYAGLPSQHPAEKTAITHMSVMAAAWFLFLISLTLRGFVPQSNPSIGVMCVDLAGFIVMLFGAWLGGSLVYHFKVGVDSG